MIQSRIIKKYLGISLVFAYKEKGVLMAHKADFAIKEGPLEYILKTADSIGTRRNWGVRGKDQEFNEYLGIYEFFRIVGPLGYGAMLGQHSFWSYKKISDANRLLKLTSNFSIYRIKDPPIGNLYIAEITYYHGTSIKYNSRRVLHCLGVVESLRKNKVIEKAIELAHSAEFKKKIILKDYEESFDPSGLEFIGIADIRPIFEKLRVGNCFQIAFRRYDNLSSIYRLVSSLEKIKKLYYLFEPESKYSK